MHVQAAIGVTHVLQTVALLWQEIKHVHLYLLKLNMSASDLNWWSCIEILHTQRAATHCHIWDGRVTPSAHSFLRIFLCSAVLQATSTLAGSQRLHCMHLRDAGSTQQGCRQYDERLHVSSIVFLFALKDAKTAAPAFPCRWHWQHMLRCGCQPRRPPLVT